MVARKTIDLPHRGKNAIVAQHEEGDTFIEGKGYEVQLYGINTDGAKPMLIFLRKDYIKVHFLPLKSEMFHHLA